MALKEKKIINSKRLIYSLFISENFLYTIDWTTAKKYKMSQTRDARSVSVRHTRRMGSYVRLIEENNYYK